MWEDLIVDEVHAIREELMARFGQDLHRYCEYVASLPAPISSTNTADASWATLPNFLPGNDLNPV